MAGTREGSLRSAAIKAGVSFEVYVEKVRSGLKWCTLCRAWHSREVFGSDKSRYDGLSSSCLVGKQKEQRAGYVPHPVKFVNPPAPPSSILGPVKVELVEEARGRIVFRGRRFVPVRDGDRRQSVGRVNYFVEIGILPHPSILPCVDCGHVVREGEPRRMRHEYDHARGYDGRNQEYVEVRCGPCHHLRHRKTYCKNGHLLSGKNLGFSTVIRNGRKTERRLCLPCRRIRDRGRRDAAYWRAYRIRRKLQ